MSSNNNPDIVIFYPSGEMIRIENYDCELYKVIQEGVGGTFEKIPAHINILNEEWKAIIKGYETMLYMNEEALINNLDDNKAFVFGTYTIKGPVVVVLGDTCYTCGDVGKQMFKCPQCLKTYYCDEKCMRADSKYHKEECRKK